MKDSLHWDYFTFFILSLNQTNRPLIVISYTKKQILFLQTSQLNHLVEYTSIIMKKQKQQQRPKEIYINRLKCDCVAQKHQLVNNCLGCGKVVCAQQGEGPCLYCGHQVTRPDTNFIISVKDAELFPTLSPQQLSKVSQQRSKAILHKDKLVQRDRSTNITQNIIDQQMDFYDVTQNQWLDQQDRQKAIDRILQKQKFVQQQKFKTKITFDHLTGQFVREQFEFDEDQFKKQGRKFVQDKQQEQFNARMRKGKGNLDKRVLQNQKMKELCQDLLTKKNQQKQASTFLKRTKQHLTEFIIQEDQTYIQQEEKIKKKTSQKSK